MKKDFLTIYNENKAKLRCKVDLERYFTEKNIEGEEVDTLYIGDINITTDQIIACDPFVSIDCAQPFIQKVKKGKYPLYISVYLNKEFGDRYAVVKLEFTKNKPVYYDLAVTGFEDDLDTIGEDEFYGFPVDAGMGTIVDLNARDAILEVFDKLNKDGDGSCNLYDDLFIELLEQSYEKNPKYQREHGDYAIYHHEAKNLDMVVFASGYGDGLYPAYFAYDENYDLCGFYIQFIDIEADLKYEEELEENEK